MCELMRDGCSDGGSLFETSSQLDGSLLFRNKQSDLRLSEETMAHQRAATLAWALGSVSICKRGDGSRGPPEIDPVTPQHLQRVNQ